MTLAVDAYAFSSTFKLRELMPMFTQLGGDTRFKDRIVVVLDEGQRYVLAYDFGAVVFVGVDAALQKRVIDELRGRFPDEADPPSTEVFKIETGAQLEVRFDRVIVPTVNLDVVDIVALILAQSAAMDFYARDVEEIEAETDRIAVTLRRTGQVPGKLRNLVQFIGLCIATRNDVISTLALFDKPDATWEKETLDKLWNDLHRMLELDDRYRALEAKLAMFQDNLVVLVDLTRQRHTVFLEVTVVVLIMFEVLVGIYQLLK